MAITDAGYLTVTQADLSGMGRVGANSVIVDDAHDVISATASGPVLIVVTRTGSGIQATTALNVQAASLPFDANASDDYEAPEPLTIEPDVYPGTLTLVPGGIRQLKVHLIDPDTGEQTDIHTVNQTTFAGSPETTEYYLDPATQTPLLDPVTGEVMLDPDTGEVMLDPNSGTIVSVVIPALPMVTSGTRYLSSDDSIATVSADGLITAHREGNVTISVLHLESQVDAYGYLTDQLIGQTDISLLVDAAQLTDTDPLTATPQGVTIAHELGGAVQSSDGLQVMIAPGALSSDEVVSIHSVALDQLGLPLPAPTVLDTLAAFQIDIGNEASNIPLQLAIPVGQGVAAGSEVLFLRKGVILDETGTPQDTWWIVDNGFVGADGVARTASPPYPCFMEGGLIICASVKSVVNKQTGKVEIVGAMINQGAIWAKESMIASSKGLLSSLSGAMTAIKVISILATQSEVFSSSYSLEGSYSLSQVTTSTDVAGNITLTLPAPTYPEFSDPFITDLNYNKTTRELTLKGVNFTPPPGQPGTKLRVWIQPKGDVFENPVDAQERGLLWKVLYDGDAKNEITVTVPVGVALSQHVAYVERVAVTQDSQGSLVSSGAGVNSNQVDLAQPNDFALVTTQYEVYYHSTDSAGGPLGLLKSETTDADGNSLDLRGRKNTQIAFSPDGTLGFIAGRNGKIYVVDTTTLSIEYTLTLKNSNTNTNITSLGVANDWLYAAEGGGGEGRLVRVSLDRHSPDFLSAQQVISLGGGDDSDAAGSGAAAVSSGAAVPGGAGASAPSGDVTANTTTGGSTPGGSGIPQALAGFNQQLNAGAGSGGYPSPFGFMDMAISGGRFLALTAPAQQVIVWDAQKQDKGNVYFLDLAKIDADGQISGDALRTLPLNALPQSNQGKCPDNISSGLEPGEFLLSNAGDYNRGLVGVKWAVDKDGNFASAPTVASTLLTPAAEKPDWWRLKFQQNIQRAKGTAIIKVDNVEYALVADFNFVFREPAWRNPDQLWGKQIGGKIGVIQDPFGKYGGPVYLGATTPIPGGAIEQLSLSPNGTLLADAWVEDEVVEGSSIGWRFYKALFEWDAYKLVAAAVANAATPTKPLDLKQPDIQPSRYNGPGTQPYYGFINSVVYTPAVYTAPLLAKDVRFGDVTKVTKEELIAAILASDAPAWIKGSVNSINNIVGDPGSASNKQALIAWDPRPGHNDAAIKDDQAAFYVVPTLYGDETKLRDGGNLGQREITVFFKADFVLKNNPFGGMGVGFKLQLKAHDTPKAAGTVFFGDRDLNDPGYSEFKLTGPVSLNGQNNPLDVWKVEQRLKYLAFPAMGYGNPTAANNKIQSFVVDGQWGDPESYAVHLFNKVINYGPGGNRQLATPSDRGVGSKAPHRSTYFNQLEHDARAEAVSKNGPIYRYLNAYNAPHWMDLFPGGSAAMPNWETTQTATTGGRVEHYGTSWLHDLMVAGANYAPPELRGGRMFVMTGATDANHGMSPFMHGTHDLGMALDLNFQHLVGYANIADRNDHGNDDTELGLASSEKRAWSVAEALSLSGKLVHTTGAGPRLNNQTAALRDFLSLYAVTMDGTRETLPVKNGA